MIYTYTWIVLDEVSFMGLGDLKNTATYAYGSAIHTGNERCPSLTLLLLVVSFFRIAPLQNPD